MTNTLGSFLDYYLDESGRGQRAVLIDGPWGSGKTHFIKAYMAERDSTRMANEPLSRRHVYVSLFGVQSTAEIADRLFASAHPQFDSWPVKLLAGAIVRAGQIATKGQAFASTDAAALKKHLLNIQGATLVFDDLERINMDVKAVFGLLNGIVEHDDVRCIVIANEQEIKSAPDYQVSKEKLFGWTMRVPSDVRGALLAFADELRNPIASTAIIENIDSLCTVLSESETGNLRITKDVFHAFDRLISHASPALRDAPQALGALLPYLLASGAEMRVRGLDADGLKMVGILPTEEANQIERRYSSVNFTDPVIPPEAWASLFLEGRFETESIEQRVSRHRLVVGDAGAPSWRRLWYWPEHSSVKDFEAAVAAVRSDLEAKTLTTSGEIMHLCGLALDLLESGYELFGDQPIARLLEYSDRLLVEGNLATDLSAFEDFGWTAYDGLGFYKKDDPRFTSFRDALHARVTVALEREIRAKASDLLSQLKCGNWSVLVTKPYGAGGFNDVAALQYLDFESMARIIVSDGGVNAQALSALSLRYNHHVTHGQPFEAERDWLGALRMEVLEIAATQTPPFGVWNTGRLTKKFDELLRAFGPIGEGLLPQ